MLLLAGTWLHPMPADPNKAVQAFAAYADDRLWVASHLAQLVGIALALGALVILARQLETGGAAVWVRLASAGAIASLALAAALQAVDGKGSQRLLRKQHRLFRGPPAPGAPAST